VVTSEAGRTRIEIPVTRTHPILIGVLCLPIVVPVVMVAPLSQFFRQSQTPDVVGWIFNGFLVTAFGILPAIAALNAYRRSRRGRTIVTVSTEGIRIEERGAWRTNQVASLPATDILDLDYSTRASFVDSARRSAEQKVFDAGHSPSAVTVGPRTERILNALSSLAKGRGLTVKTRTGLTTFGQGLADDEIQYLYSVVRRALVSR
jgi:hypothetical protein